MHILCANFEEEIFLLSAIPDPNSSRLRIGSALQVPLAILEPRKPTAEPKWEKRLLTRMWEEAGIKEKDDLREIWNKLKRIESVNRAGAEARLADKRYRGVVIDLKLQHIATASVVTMCIRSADLGQL